MMGWLLETLNFVFALGGIVLLFSALYLVYDYCTERFLQKYILQFGILAAFLITFLGSATSLIYSEYFGFIPCGLCWLQRVCLYPQVLLLGTALWIKDKTVVVYGMILCIPGVVIGLYQHYLQMGGTDLIGCPAAGPGADCSERILFEFGFMTLPLLSSITFFFLIVLYFYIFKTKDSKHD